MAKRQGKPKLNLPDRQLRVGVVQALFNQDVTDAQLSEVQELLAEYSVEFDLYTIPGSFEIPYMLQELAASGRYDGLVALGCLVKGGTIHFEVIAHSLPPAFHALVREFKLPIGFGIITANSHDQALERTWLGSDAAHAVLQSISETESLRS